MRRIPPLIFIILIVLNLLPIRAFASPSPEEKGKVKTEKETKPMQFQYALTEKGITTTISLNQDMKYATGEWQIAINGQEIEQKPHGGELTVQIPFHLLFLKNEVEAKFIGQVKQNQVNLATTDIFLLDHLYEKAELDVNLQLAEEGLKLTASLQEEKKAEGDWIVTLNGEKKIFRDQLEKLMVEISSKELQELNQISVDFIGKAKGKQVIASKETSFRFTPQEIVQPSIEVKHEFTEKGLLITSVLAEVEKAEGVWKINQGEQTVATKAGKGKEMQLLLPQNKIQSIKGKKSELDVRFVGNVDGQEVQLQKRMVIVWPDVEQIVQPSINVTHKSVKNGVQIKAILSSAEKVCGTWKFRLNQEVKERKDCKGSEVTAYYPSSQLQKNNQLTVSFVGEVNGKRVELSELYSFSWDHRIEIKVKHQLFHDRVKFTLQLAHGVGDLSGDWVFDLNGSTKKVKNSEKKLVVSFAAEELRKANRLKMIFYPLNDEKKKVLQTVYEFVVPDAYLDQLHQMSHQGLSQGQAQSTDPNPGHVVQEQMPKNSSISVGGFLPKTATNTLLWGTIGILLIIVGGWFVYQRRL